MGFCVTVPLCMFANMLRSLPLLVAGQEHGCGKGRVDEVPK